MKPPPQFLGPIYGQAGSDLMGLSPLIIASLLNCTYVLFCRVQ